MRTEEPLSRKSARDRKDRVEKLLRAMEHQDRAAAKQLLEQDPTLVMGVTGHKTLQPILEAALRFDHKFLSLFFQYYRPSRDSTDPDKQRQYKEFRHARCMAADAACHKWYERFQAGAKIPGPEWTHYGQTLSRLRLDHNKQKQKKKKR